MASKPSRPKAVGSPAVKEQAGGQQAAKDPASDRKARLAEQLRANLQRRKAQARSRRTGEPDQRPEGLGTGQDPTSDTQSDQD